MGMGTTTCTLVTSSCTTGWFDWIHGERWLCTNGLLRKSVGLIGTFRHADSRGRLRRTISDERPTRTFDTQGIASIVASDRRNRWITWDEIKHATLKLGVVDHSLHLDLDDGRRAKFLWLKLDGGFDLLDQALSESLGTRFDSYREPI